MAESSPHILAIRKLADKSTGMRLKRFDPETGEAYLYNPATDRAEGWPLAGVQIEGEVPKTPKISTTYVTNAVVEGWMEFVNPRLVVRPAGPAHARETSLHGWTHADELILHTVDGDVRFKVVKNPDKFVDSDDPTEPVTDEHYAAGNTRVDHFYELEHIDG